MRIRNCIIGFFGVIVAVSFLDINFITKFSTLLAGISVFLIMAAGNMINDYFDFEIDKINKKNRPLPSGRIRKGDVLMLSILFFFSGIAIAKSINIYCLLLAILNSILLMIYDRYSKKILFISNLGVSYLIISIFIFGVFSISPRIIEEISKEEVILLSVLITCAFLMTLSREIIKDIEDLEGDKIKGAVTIPTKFGKKNAKNLAIIFTIVAVSISFLPFLSPIPLTNFDLYVYGFFISIADILFLISLTMNPSIMQRLMVFSMTLALIGFFLGKFITASSPLL